MPPPFIEYFRQVQEMEFEQDPDYAGLQKIFTDYLKQNDEDVTIIEMDWTSTSLENSLDKTIEMMDKLLEYVENS